jgi:hypothetical protein
MATKLPFLSQTISRVNCDKIKTILFNEELAPNEAESVAEKQPGDDLGHGMVLQINSTRKIREGK